MDRRSEYRVKWNDAIQYRTFDTGAYKTGIVKNISIHGAFLWLQEDLDIGTSLELLTGSHGKQQSVRMRVVRTEETDHEVYAGYGCRVEMRMPVAA